MNQMKRSLFIALGTALVAVAILAGLSMRRKPEVKVIVPETYRVLFETSQGNFVVEVKHAWAPRGADRFHQLVRMGYYTESRFSTRRSSMMK